MSIAVPARKRVLIKIALSIATVLSLFFSVASAASPSDWNRLSDRQIARLLFPEEKLYFEPTLEGLPMLDPASLDGVNVYEVKRVVANFDNDPENEMAVLIHYSTGMCTFCIGTVIFAILDKQKGEVRIAWRTEKQEAFNTHGSANISAMKLIKNDKFFELAFTYDSSPIETGSSYKKMQIIRWNGKRFAEIWSYDLEGYDGGNRGGIPHDYLAKVDFLDDQKAKRIKVASLYTTRPHREEQRVQYKLDEEFAWNEKTQMYQPVKQYEVKYEKGETCVSYRKHAPKDESQCYGETAYQRGSEYLQQGDYDQAIRAFSEALELTPRSANAYSNRGLAHTQKRQYDKAIADFNEALKIDPKSTDTLRYRGFAYVQQGQYDQAISDYTKALEINPKSADAYHYRALAYQRKGQYDEAISDYTRVSEINPGNPWSYISRGGAYYDKGDYDLAIADYTTALGMKPLADWAYYTRGLAYWKKGQHDLAIFDLTLALGNPNVIADAYYHRGRVYTDKGEYDKATADFNKALEINPKNTEVYFYKAQAYERAGRRKEAVKTYKAFIQNVPSNLGPLIEQAAKKLAELQK